MWVEIIRFTAKGKHDTVQTKVVQRYTLARQEERRGYGPRSLKHQKLLARKPSWLDGSASTVSVATTCSAQSLDAAAGFAHQ